MFAFARGSMTYGRLEGLSITAIVPGRRFRRSIPNESRR
jgi:hypothetical protein